MSGDTALASVDVEIASAVVLEVVILLRDVEETPTLLDDNPRFATPDGIHVVIMVSLCWL